MNRLRPWPVFGKRLVSATGLCSNAASAPGQTGGGFTLIELLVVIAIIAMLAAMLLPSLTRAKALGQSARCKSNLHQMGVALRMYLDDFQKYPQFSSTTPPAVNPRFGFWDYKLLSYCSSNQNLFLCPSVTGPINSSKNWSPVIDATGLHPNRSYGYNSSGWLDEMRFGLGGGYSLKALPENQVVISAEMIAVADYDPLTPIGEDGDGDGDYNPNPNAAFLFTDVIGRHNRGANVLFCDGRVEYGKTNVWKGLQNAQKWNYDHRWH